MSDDLVKRLRMVTGFIRYETGDSACLSEEAADRIEKLEADLAQALVHLEWFISEDETNRGDDPMPERGNRTWDEINAYWLKHLDSAIAFVAEIKGDRDG